MSIEFHDSVNKMMREAQAEAVQEERTRIIAEIKSQEDKQYDARTILNWLKMHLKMNEHHHEYILFGMVTDMQGITTSAYKCSCGDLKEITT